MHGNLHIQTSYFQNFLAHLSRPLMRLHNLMQSLTGFAMCALKMSNGCDWCVGLGSKSSWLTRAVRMSAADGEPSSWQPSSWQYLGRWWRGGRASDAVLERRQAAEEHHGLGVGPPAGRPRHTHLLQVDITDTLTYYR